MDAIFQLIAPHLHRRVVAYPLVLVAGVVLYVFLSLNFVAPPWIGAIGTTIAVALAIGAFEVWIAPQRISRNKIGVLVAVVGETSQGDIKLRSDFTSQIRSILVNSPGESLFEVIVLPRFLAVQVTDRECATRVMNRSRAHFLVFGDLRERKEKGRSYHVLRLQSLVRHHPIEKEKQNLLSREMSSALPQKVQIDSDNDLVGFELTSQQFAAGAKFVIATAAVLSKDWRLGLQLLGELVEILPVIKKQGKALGGSRLPRLIERRFVAVSSVVAEQSYLRWRGTRDPESLHIALRILEVAAHYERKLPQLHTQRAINAFVFDRDCRKARDELGAAMRIDSREPSIHYGLAFLDAYEGRLDEAWKKYQRAFELDRSQGLPVEVEEFIAWALEEDPNQTQLLYCLGVLNYLRKRDMQAARSDFNEFLVRTPEDKFLVARQYATRILKRLGSNEVDPSS